MYCLIESILFWNSALAAFMLVIMLPMLPTMVAKMRTPMRKSTVTKRYSTSCTGWGVSPIKDGSGRIKICIAQNN